jgi:hypothetical protein
MSDRFESEIRTARRLLDEKQAAKVLNKPVRTLQADRQRGGGIPFIKLGRSVRYDLLVIEQYLRQQTRTSTSQPEILGGDEVA